MAYADVQMFMAKLEQLMYCNDIPLINNPSILCERPQFQILHEELGSMIQTLFNHEDLQDLHNFEKVRKLKKRFKAAAEEAEDILDIFLTAVHCRHNGYIPRSDIFHPSLHLDVVMQSLKSIKMEFMAMMQIDSDKGRLQMQSAAGTSRSRSSLRSKRVSEEMVVGFGRDAEIIRDKLVEDRKQLDVVSIVGMGGIGKTTLATKVFNDPFFVHHFYVRGWVTVSQAYDKRDLLIQVLSSIDKEVDQRRDKELELEKATDYQLHEMLHKILYRKRYLIVIDDIWSKEAWDNLKLFFPDHNNRSRILLTSRLTEVASHAKLSGLIHHIQQLKEEESWELLCREVFQGDACPEWLIEPGRQIAKNCHGLPLSVVVMAGVLAKEQRSKDFWLKISCSVNSYIASDEKGCLETIALSYHHLPLHLRDCFLYLGGIPEDFQIYSLWLIRFWMAEGFIQEDGSRSLEETANGYLMDLVDRNLLIVEERLFSGDVYRCKVHDLVRQLCEEKGKEERFFLKIDWPPSKHPCQVIITHKQRRMFTNQEIDIISLSHPPTPSIRSLVSYHRKTTLTNNIPKFFRSFALLRVLSLGKCEMIDYSPGLALLIHLRYLDIWQSSFPPSICNLWNLQTLFLSTSSSCMVLPSNISNLVNLRILGSNADLYLPSIGQPMNLEVITNVELGDGVDNFEKCFPRIKELTSTLYSDEENDFEGLLYLQTLILIGSDSRRSESVEPQFLIGEPKMQKNHIIIRFPATLKQLYLERCRLQWSDMSIIQSLPDLVLLKLKENAFEGTLWEAGEEQFQQLKFLRLQQLNIKQWEASSINFPRLEQLEVRNCVDLEEIPLDIGEISTLEYINVLNCRASLLVSLQKIRQEQDDAGNYELKITFNGRHVPSFVPTHDS